MNRILVLIILASTVIAASACSQCQQTMESKQQAMVEHQIRFRGISDPRVLAVMRDVPRVEFVEPAHQAIAYDDVRAPIGYGQTLDRPYEDALILETIDLKPTDKVLEVGTGSGYLAALMAKLAKEVYTIEIIGPLGDRAETTMRRLGYDNVHVRVGDGFLGWKEHAPFDVIVLTASPSTIPQPLKEQLAEGGRLLLPLGGEERFQELLLYTKKNGKIVREQRIAPAAFVPMKGIVEEKK